MIDIAHQVEDPETMPLCPLCDQPIFSYELVEVGVAHGCAALIHQDCAEGAINE